VGQVAIQKKSENGFKTTAWMHSLDRYFLANSSCAVECTAHWGLGLITIKGTAGQKRLEEQSRVSTFVNFCHDL
jgi:hypothetical protein